MTSQPLSSCCKAPLGLGGNTTHFYICKKCKMPCDLSPPEDELETSPSPTQGDAAGECKCLPNEECSKCIGKNHNMQKSKRIEEQRKELKRQQRIHKNKAGDFSGGLSAYEELVAAIEKIVSLRENTCNCDRCSYCMNGGSKRKASLEDVLRALQEHCDDPSFKVKLSECSGEVLLVTDSIVIAWTLGKPLSEQSPETISFLHSLLCK